MKATVTSKGRVTIPVEIRKRLCLEPGDVLEFDETAPFLKATKSIPPEAWDEVRKQWKDPWVKKTIPEVVEVLRGPVELPLGT